MNQNDVQPFVGVCLAPLEAPRRCYCIADMDADGFITEADRQQFVHVLLGLCLPGEPCAGTSLACPDGSSDVDGGGGGSNAAMAGGSGESGGGNSGSGNSERQRRYAQLAAWDAAHARPDCAYLSADDLAWCSSRNAYMVELGLMTQALADGSAAFNAWEAVNRRADHPELSAAEYMALVATRFEADVIANIGGNP